MSPWLPRATVTVEDARFEDHVGVDPSAVLRALGQNIYHRRTVSGASTITMQVCRMMDGRSRTWGAKLIESFRALQLERIRTKDEILETYLNIAPYGGNCRGVEAAARAYFNKHAADLSLGEAALLAGLPQSPSRYRPDRYPQRALERRNTVLRRMEASGHITASQRAVAESQQPDFAPKHPRAGETHTAASHAAWMALRRSPDGCRTAINLDLQREVHRIAREHANSLPRGTNIAGVVIDIVSADIVAMLGSLDEDDPIDGQVNGALAKRSPGSTLKPFIYAAAFEARRLNADSIVHDVEIDRAGWSPRNFDRTFAGALPAGEALRRSLNVPAILVAEAVGIQRCVGLMRTAGLPLPENAAERGGLALAVGGLEVTLLDLTNAYATLGRGGVKIAPRLCLHQQRQAQVAINTNVCATIDDVLSSRRRRPAGMKELDPGQVPWFMWKTGTSSGRRDAWAVGHNRRYAVGVWVGRFSGAGDAAYVGSTAAEPVLARIFAMPDVRQNDDPPAPNTWIASRPIPPPVEIAGPLKILSPAPNASFIALDGMTLLRPRANRSAPLRWFLDGRHLSEQEARRIAVPIGRHELRCVTPTGQSAAADFTVSSGYEGSVRRDERHNRRHR